MSTLLEFGTDIGGRNAYAPQPCTNLYSSTLTANTAASIQVPVEAIGVYSWVVSFSYEPGSAVWVDFTGATAAIPAGATFAKTTSELNPGARFIKTFKNDGITQNSISLITAGTSVDVGVSFYALPKGQ